MRSQGCDEGIEERIVGELCFRLKIYVIIESVVIGMR